MNMHIRQNKLLKNGIFTANYNLKKKLCKKFADLDWDNNKKIEKTMAKTKDNEAKAKNFWKKNKKLKNKKIH